MSLLDDIRNVLTRAKDPATAEDANGFLQKNAVQYLNHLLELLDDRVIHDVPEDVEALREGIQRGELRVQYQPIVQLQTGELAGFEALVRWMHPTKGFLYPAHFIAAAERAGVVLDVDRWVMAEACAQLKRWQSVTSFAEHLTVSVNLSAKQLSNSNIVLNVRRLLDESGLDRQCLRLELTESSLIENNGAALLALKELNRDGTMLFLDDFGTGYSSLAYLHKYPIFAVKIDRSFIGRMRPSGGGGTLVQAIVNLAHALNLYTVAEGIEIEEQMMSLRSMGCNYGQGFYFSPPLPADQALELIKSGRIWLPRAP